ncbi:MAG: hypothetical protein CSA58_03600 [Micrococcales bacterium]|nr:MAG: hypothetical protein CSB46_11300 [Micrococcales bacterium]PIE27565.1 MAG: hypothetical protein CSA58_03600 [Micrococcales bacterium]
MADSRFAPARSGRAFTGPVLTGLAGFGALAVVAARDPHVPGSWGTCRILSLTGWYCPGCGGLRAMHDLLHGDVVAALSSNLYAVGLAALGLAIWLHWTASVLRGQPFMLRWLPERTLVLAATAGLVLFSVLRNTPVLGFLAP